MKASLLFLQKFSEQEQAEFEEKKAEAHTEIEVKYRNEIAAQVAVFEADIEEAKNDKQPRAELMKALRDYRRDMQVKIDREARALLKERFAYPIFLYEAEKVGITATGEDDQNELYPNPNVPLGIEKTTVELCREFRKNPKSFFPVEGAA